MVFAELALEGLVRVNEELTRAWSVVLVALLQEKNGESLFGDGRRPVVPRSIDALPDPQDAFEAVARVREVALGPEHDGERV